MNINLTAKEINAGRGPFTVFLAFLLEGVFKDELFTIDRAIDPQDDIIGINGIGMVRNEQEYSVNGGVINCVISRSRFFIEFDDVSARQLGGWKVLLIDFNADERQYSKIIESLLFIFNKCECLTIKSV